MANGSGAGILLSGVKTSSDRNILKDYNVNTGKGRG
jgi:hypothetical protein